jgi:hypothetical protein
MTPIIVIIVTDSSRIHIYSSGLCCIDVFV